MDRQIYLEMDRQIYQEMDRQIHNKRWTDRYIIRDGQTDI